jgi:hypothetical protein
MEKNTYQTNFSTFYLTIFRLNLYRKNKKQGPQKKQIKNINPIPNVQWTLLEQNSEYLEL